jgi:hypothetical protein
LVWKRFSRGRLAGPRHDDIRKAREVVEQAVAFATGTKLASVPEVGFHKIHMGCGWCGNASARTTWPRRTRSASSWPTGARFIETQGHGHDAPQGRGLASVSTIHMGLVWKRFSEDVVAPHARPRHDDIRKACKVRGLRDRHEAA